MPTTITTMLHDSIGQLQLAHYIDGELSPLAVFNIPDHLLADVALACLRRVLNNSNIPAAANFPRLVADYGQLLCDRRNGK